MHSNQDKDSISEKSSKGDDLNLSEEDYSGYLSMKSSGHKKHSYPKTWCVLKNKLLSVYKKQDGKPLEDINVSVFKINPIKKDGSNNFSFQINNNWNDYLFSTKHENEYEIWMKKLQSIQSNNNTTNNADKNGCILKQFSRDECTSSFEKTDSVDKFDLKSPNHNGFDEVDDTYCSVNDNNINTEEKITSSDTFFDDVYCNEDNEKDTNKLQSTKDFETESQTSIRSGDNFHYQSDFSDENCKGYLWICDEENTYVRLWCSLENKILGLYDEKDGDHLQDIKIENSTIIPVKRNKSNNFYFRIISDETEYKFGTRSGNEYEEWIKKMQSIALNINNIK